MADFLVQCMQASDLSDFSAFVEQTRLAQQIPGLAVAAVYRGELVLNQGFGELDVTTKKPVNTQSLLPIASLTKPFIATALAKLVARGSVDWDTPLKTILPNFHLQDQRASACLSVADSLCHNSGLGYNSAAALACFGARDAETLLAQMQYIQPTAAFGHCFQYHNGMYLWAAKVIEAISDQSWQQFLADEIFQPLNMTDTYCSLAEVSDANRLCQLHGLRADKLTSYPYLDAPDTLAPAGGLVSCSDDMAQWLLANACDDSRLLSLALWQQLRQARVSTQLNTVVNRYGVSLSNTNYALGWFSFAYRAYHGVEHRGGYPGVSSLMCVMPEQQTGIVLLSNRDQCRATLNALRLRFIDIAFGLPQYDWLSDLNGLMQRQAEHFQRQLSERQQAVAINNLSVFTGQFHNNTFGILMIELQEDKLILRIGARPVTFHLIPNNELEFSLFSNEAYGVMFNGSRLLFTPDKQQATLELVSHDGYGEFAVATREVIIRAP